jgi:hypothetical protein
MDRKTRNLITRQVPKLLLLAFVAVTAAMMFLTGQELNATLLVLVGMAVTADQLITRSDFDRGGGPVYQSTILYGGTFVFWNSGGFLDDDTASGANKFAGMAVKRYDNSAGADGDIQADIWTTGGFTVTGSGFAQSSVGLDCFATDNYTATLTSTGNSVRIGRIIEYISSTKVRVEIAPFIPEALTVESGTFQAVIFNGPTGVNELRIPTNQADALSIESSAGDVIVFDTTTGTVVVTFGAAVRLNVAGDAQIGSATTDLVAFHGATPTDQCPAYTQTYATADRTHAAPTAAALTVTDGAGSNDNTIGAITADASVIAAVQELADEINKLVADVADVKQIVNAVIDDLQEKGISG